MLDSFLKLNTTPQLSPWLILMLLWILAWKGVALWRAARNTHKGWFVALLILNTFGILPITYIFFFSKPKLPSTQV